jgi:hypothetical protein
MRKFAKTLAAAAGLLKSTAFSLTARFGDTGKVLLDRNNPAR